MFCTMSARDFDNRVKNILDEEFTGILCLGILTEESLFPVVAQMQHSLRGAFPEMSMAESEFHLQLLRDQCRKTANSIVATTCSTYQN